VVTKPFQFEGQRRMKVADSGINELQKAVDTLIVIPNQNLFRVATERTTFADAFAMADQVLYSGVACITDLMVKEGLINLDFADVRAIMREMGKAMMGTGEASGDKRAILAAEAAIANPLLDEVSMKGARGLLISITGGNDLTLYEVDEAASRIRQEVDEEANIILGATFDESLEGVVRVSVVATGIDKPADTGDASLSESRIAEAAQRLRAQAASRHAEQAAAAPIVVQTPPAEPIRPAAPVYAAPEPAQPVHLQEVHIQPAPPRPHYEHASAPRTQDYAPQPGPFIPPAAEQPIRAPRMPQIEDLPLPVQQQIRAQRGEAPAENPTETRRRTLLERLASFGMSRQEEAHHAPAQVPALPAPPRMAPQPARPAPSPVHTEYARRPAAPAPAPAPRQAQLDPHGRATPVVRSSEDDHLEIPAFLRRQSS
jgi:cell division protein FtsZ